MNSNLLFNFSVDKENKTIHVTREFDAQLKWVWQAWTTAELLDQWWAPLPSKQNQNLRLSGRRYLALCDDWAGRANPLGKVRL